VTLLAEAVTLRRGSSTILREVSVAVPACEIVAILGANGAGKSTLLRVLAGELEPQLGEVRLADRPLAAWDRRELARRRASVAPARPIEFPFLVEELVGLGRHPHPSDPALDRRCVAEAMVLTEVAHLAGRNHAGLSTGERQRVELARALAQLGPPSVARPSWLLLDEPTANLDLAHALVLLERLRDLCRAGYGIAMVVHDLGLALRFADRVVLLHAGRVLLHGAPGLFVERPQLLREAFGLDAEVIPHPRGGWPVVLPTAAYSSELGNRDPSRSP
jgi:iron complex transport system ATP-binding protein